MARARWTKARDFTDADYMRAAAPVDFFATVSGGRDTMPGFKDTLSDEERWNAVYYLWHFSVADELLAQGKPVYETNCVACHGPEGQGAIPQAAKFSPEFISKFPHHAVLPIGVGGQGHHAGLAGSAELDERWAAIEYARAFALRADEVAPGMPILKRQTKKRVTAEVTRFCHPLLWRYRSLTMFEISSGFQASAGCFRYYSHHQTG